MSHKRPDWSFLPFHTHCYRVSILSLLIRCRWFKLRMERLARSRGDQWPTILVVFYPKETHHIWKGIDFWFVHGSHMPPCILIVSFHAAPPTGVIYMFICFLLSLEKHSKEQKGACWLGLSPCFSVNQNVIYSPRLSHGDPIYWLAHGGGGEGVITSKYHTGTAAGLLIGSVKVTWFQLDWRSDFDSVCCQECFCWPYSSLCGWSDESTFWWKPLLRDVGAYWGLGWEILWFHWKRIKFTGALGTILLVRTLDVLPVSQQVYPGWNSALGDVTRCMHTPVMSPPGGRHRFCSWFYLVKEEVGVLWINKPDGILIMNPCLVIIIAWYSTKECSYAKLDNA